MHRTPGGSHTTKGPLTGLADRVPRWARIIPGAASTVILAEKFGFINFNNIQLNVKVDPLALVISSVAIVPISVAVLLHKRRKVKRKPENKPLCHIHRVRVEDHSAGQLLVRLVDRRSKDNSVINYVLASVSGRIGSGNFLFICGTPGLVEREVDILEASVSVMGDGLRLEKVGYIDYDFSRYLPSGSKGDDPSLLLTVGGRIPESSLAGKRLFKLGYRIDTPVPEDVYIHEADVSGHIGVFGSTGAGKSTTLRKIFSNLPHSWGTTIVLDWTGEHSELALPHATVYRPYRGEAGLNPLDSSLDTMALLDIISSALGLTDPQSYMLLTILSSRRPTDFAELYTEVLEMEEASKWDREVKRALARKLSTIISDIDAFRENSAQSIFGEQGRLFIIDLSGFRSVRGKKAYSLTLLALAYHSVARSRTNNRLALVIDEAHNVFESDSIIAESIASEARKFGLSLIYATQSPSHIHNRIILNTNTKIVHSLRSLQDKEYIARSMSVDGKLASKIDKLAPGEAILQATSNPQPILIKIEAQ